MIPGADLTGIAPPTNGLRLPLLAGIDAVETAEPEFTDSCRLPAALKDEASMAEPSRSIVPEDKCAFVPLQGVTLERHVGAVPPARGKQCPSKH